LVDWTARYDIQRSDVGARLASKGLRYRNSTARNWALPDWLR
jgi:hypothetical protein